MAQEQMSTDGPHGLLDWVARSTLVLTFFCFIRLCISLQGPLTAARALCYVAAVLLVIVPCLTVPLTWVLTNKLFRTKNHAKQVVFGFVLSLVLTALNLNLL